MNNYINHDLIVISLILGGEIRIKYFWVYYSPCIIHSVSLNHPASVGAQDNPPNLWLFLVSFRNCHTVAVY